MIIEEATQWKVIALFDYDDFYQVGRDIVVDGKQAYQQQGSRYRNEANAQAFADKLNSEEK